MSFAAIHINWPGVLSWQSNSAAWENMYFCTRYHIIWRICTLLLKETPYGFDFVFFYRKWVRILIKFYYKLQRITYKEIFFLIE